MLNNIPPIVSPDLLKILSEMGHGDEIVIADGNFPGASLAKRIIRADGHDVSAFLKAILTLMPLDQYSKEKIILMQVAKGDHYIPIIWQDFKTIVNTTQSEGISFQNIERFEFYKRAKEAYAIIQTSDKALYANVILKKGVL